MTQNETELGIPIGKGRVNPSRTLQERGPTRQKSLIADPKLRWLAALTVLSYLLLVFWALNDATLRKWLSPVPSTLTQPAIEAIGPVLKVNYIGGAQVHTQVDTSTQTLLLNGPVRMALHSELEIRRHASKPTLVCVVQTQQCASLYE